MEKRPQILLTNDDGIRSPGLWAAAGVLSKLGFVTVAAPREQFSGAGRSLPSTTDGVITVQEMVVNDQSWTVYAVGGTPAQTVLHAILEIMPERPDLVVSGINFGENVGSGVTISGTVGAALEAASLGIPALAASLETETKHHFSHSEEVDFTVAAYFTFYFADLMLKRRFPFDVDVLKVDVPCDAAPQTPWSVTRLSRMRYYEPLTPQRNSWSDIAQVGYRQACDPLRAEQGSDVHALCVRRVVSVTPLSLDLTSRVDLDSFEAILRQS